VEWSVLAQGKVRSAAMVISDIIGENAAQMGLTENDKMIETFAPY
jgi:hypothetical protein